MQYEAESGSVLHSNKEAILGKGMQLLLHLSGVQILDKEVFHYGNYPDSSDKSFMRQGEYKVGMASCLDLDYLSLLIKLFGKIAYILLLLESHL